MCPGVATPLPVRCRRRQRLPSHLSDSIVEAPTGVNTTITEYRTLVYYATIDTLLDEMNRRFNELNLTLLQSLQALVPNSDTFLDLASLCPFLSHYGVDKDGLASELLVASTLKRGLSSLHVTPCLFSSLSSEGVFSSLTTNFTDCHDNWCYFCISRAFILHSEEVENTSSFNNVARTAKQHLFITHRARSLK